MQWYHRSNSSIFGHRLQRVFPLEKNILCCFVGRKYSEHFDLTFSCLHKRTLWTVRIIYLNVLLLLLFYLRETLSFQGSFGFCFFINLYLATTMPQAVCLE